MGNRTYSTNDDAEIAIGANLWGTMQKCMEMDFFGNKVEIDKCFFEITAAQAAMIEDLLKGDGSSVVIPPTSFEAALNVLIAAAAGGDADAQATIAALAAVLAVHHANTIIDPNP